MVYIHLLDLHIMVNHMVKVCVCKHTSPISSLMGKTLTSNIPTAASQRSAELCFFSRSRSGTAGGISKDTLPTTTLPVFTLSLVQRGCGEWMVRGKSWYFGVAGCCGKNMLGLILGESSPLPNSLRKVYPVSLQIATFWYPQNRLPHHHFCYPC